MSNTTPRRRSPRPHAFTLIEILVVVSIIAILASLLFSALGNVKKTTRVSACANNLKQIAHALTHFRTDNSRFFGLNSGSGSNTMSPLFDYIDNFDMLTCPATGNFLDIDRDDPAAAATKLDATPPTDILVEGKSYESAGKFSGGSVITTHTIRGFEADTWFVWENDNPDVDQELSNRDNHGALGGNALNGNLAVVWVTGAEWNAKVTSINDKSN